eukprot:jgi/Tetstr1/448834/TSEL_036060.t1
MQSPRGDESADNKYAKHQDRRTRQRLSWAAFWMGLVAGFIIAERYYISQNPSYYSGTQPSVRDVATAGRHSSEAGSARELRPEPTQIVRPAVQSARGGASAAGLSAAHSKADLLQVLQTVAPSKEVLIAISDYNLVREGMLTTWVKCVQRAGVKNYLVVGLDEEIYKHLKGQGVPVFFKNRQIAQVQAGTGNNHAISALKFGIIHEFLELGWSVLLSDVDIVTLQDPFQHLYRDSDVEGMSDGFDDRTAYGFIDGIDDPSMGWSRYAQAVKHFNLNSGLFYLRANERTIDLMQRLETRLSKQKYWDQTAYNEEIFFLSHGSYKSPQVTVRVMEINEFMNSKVLFKFWRHKPQTQRSRPVMIHINYHPDKHNRMLGVIRYFYDKDLHALDKFPGGSEPGT